ncbi:hypothetical protein LOK49_LG06G01336 [Camellia lanceoleosa]|uniref:Uncharacterized protein n=1 Tax=Camellia lanceoleosa TaxID=1840588 RepID=A0ACC0HHD4_9ERIC|nr:hypothetical protein LOK49_LG06G01336 [Camellia lanceoleosa]
MSSRYTKERSNIVVIGLSVHTTPVEMREKLVVPEAEWPRAIAKLCSLNHIEEAVVLSTCNRMEIYIVALSQHRGMAKKLLSRSLNRMKKLLFERARMANEACGS